MIHYTHLLLHSTFVGPIFHYPEKCWLSVLCNCYTFTLIFPGVGCGGTLTGINGSLTSPGYPVNYTAASTCNWLIQVPARRVITLTFTDMRMFDPVNCETDFVIVYNGDSDESSQFARFCGAVSHLNQIVEMCKAVFQQTHKKQSNELSKK